MNLAFVSITWIVLDWIYGHQLYLPFRDWLISWIYGHSKPAFSLKRKKFRHILFIYFVSVGCEEHSFQTHAGQGQRTIGRSLLAGVPPSTMWILGTELLSWGVVALLAEPSHWSMLFYFCWRYYTNRNCHITSINLSLISFSLSLTHTSDPCFFLLLSHPLKTSHWD